MKILMINKFLHPNGGSETYIFKLGAYLQKCGHEVQYFGMDHKKRCVGNAAGIYTAPMDFHSDSILENLTYTIRTIYSVEAQKKVRIILDDFQPDVVHLNNFTYQLTPSVILEIQHWRKQTGSSCKIVFTAHDYNLLCPNHMLKNPLTGQLCEQCLGGKYINCIKGRCIHGSMSKSIVGALEAYIWNTAKIYRSIDCIICCSGFMKNKMDSNPLFAQKTVLLRNFTDPVTLKKTEKKEYILYFGRYSKEKGVRTLLNVCRKIPEVPFVFAGSGPLEEEIGKVKNIHNIGFQTGVQLEKYIREAKFSVYPSEWYENCPFSVMESQLYGTPVLGADIGGIPELIRTGIGCQDNATGELFESGNETDLREKILLLWKNSELTGKYRKNCQNVCFDTVEEYTDKLMELYRK